MHSHIVCMLLAREPSHVSGNMVKVPRNALTLPSQFSFDKCVNVAVHDKASFKKDTGYQCFCELSEKMFLAYFPLHTQYLCCKLNMNIRFNQRLLLFLLFFLLLLFLKQCLSFVLVFCYLVQQRSNLSLMKSAFLVVWNMCILPVCHFICDLVSSGF